MVPVVCATHESLVVSTMVKKSSSPKILLENDESENCAGTKKTNKDGTEQ